MSTKIDPLEITEQDIQHSTSLIHDPSAAILAPVMNLALAKQRLAEFQDFVKGYLVPGEDYGLIPGVKKPSLFKPGAEKLCELYGLADTYPEDGARRVENWDTGLFFYEFTCRLTRKGTDIVVGEGKGSCSTYESRYRFRDASRICPECGKETIIKGKQEYGGGWLCFKKKGGCGQKWPDGEPVIESQEIGKVENENMCDVINTVLKMAKKRAKIDAVIAATRSSGIFTQDVEDTKAAASKEEEKPVEPQTDVVNGILEDPKFHDGNLWMKVSGTPAVARKEKKEVIERLGGLHGEQVELLVSKMIGKGDKPYYEIKGIMTIGQPVTEQEAIPF